MQRKLPAISVVIATYNSAKTLSECLESVACQDYPKEKIEIILADGGSRDATFSVARKFNARVLHINAKKQGAEYNRARGASVAKNEILLFIDHDNVLPHTTWLRKMVRPFQDDPKMVGVETLRYTYNRGDSFIGRYFSLFGANDIFAFYVGKADRIAYFFDTPGSYGVFKDAIVIDRKSYFSVDFNDRRIPTLGSNGFMVRKSILFANAKTNPDEFFHIDVNVDLIRAGFNRYAFIKDSLHHKTDERGLWDYLRRRKLFMEKYHYASMSKRRYSLYEEGDFWPTFKFIILSLTLVVPFIDACRGYIKIKDTAWFLNPVMSFSLVILYGFAIIQRQITTYANNLLGK